MDEFRAQLDALMGEDRNVPLAERDERRCAANQPAPAAAAWVSCCLVPCCCCLALVLPGA